MKDDTIDFLRGEAARKAYGFPAKATFHEKIKRGLVPPPVKFGSGTSMFPKHEAQQVVAARIAGKSDDEIRAVVEDICAARKTHGVRHE